MSDSISYVLYGAEAKDGGITANDADLEKLRSTRILDRGIVIETMCDPSLRGDPPDSLVEGAADEYLRAPRNSLVVRVLSDESSRAKNSDVVCYPIFSSHLAMPVKPGEQVWVVRERLMAEVRSGRVYWLCRVPEGLALEDTNFTPFTRDVKFLSTGSNAVGDERKLHFPNEILQDFFVIDGDDEAIKAVMTDSLESGQVIREPVPRLTKRPGDLVIQGSNNTTISLGTDRGFDLATRPVTEESSSASVKPEPTAGSIDIVTGRGRYFETNDDEIKKPRDDSKKAGPEKSTAAFIVKNTLDEFETDKDPGDTQERDPDNDLGDHGAPAKPGNTKTNPKEGDPDFLVDASRIYISEKTDVDKKLGLDQIFASDINGDAMAPASPAPAIAVKTDHVRIVARKIDAAFDATKEALPAKATDNAATNGTIRIVKEGKPDEDLAVIYISADGSIQISGAQIFIGRSEPDGGRMEGPGDGGSQPYVRYSDLEKLWQDTMDALDKFCTTVSTHVTPGYGAPSPQLNQAAADLKSDVASLKPQIEEVKSERIFGE